jgi:hypothetical protein
MPSLVGDVIDGPYYSSILNIGYLCPPPPPLSLLSFFIAQSVADGVLSLYICISFVLLHLWLSLSLSGCMCTCLESVIPETDAVYL